jgi:hypothetical protein
MFQVVGWQPPSPAKPGTIVRAEHDDRIGLAAMALPENQRSVLIDLLQRHRCRHPADKITHLANCSQAVMHCTSRTPTHGHTRDAIVVSLEPAEGATRFPTPRRV